MADTPRPEGHRKPGAARTGVVGVTLVLILAGILLATNARLAANAPQAAQDFPGLVQGELDRSEAMLADVDRLRAEVDLLTDAGTDALPARQDDLLAFWAGLVPAAGPGLTVTLTDAPATAPRPAWATANDLVIHQQDLQAVINALWAGGAEAMTLQGERVIATSAFRCVGNVLLLHGRHFSPPYVVRAIGVPDDLAETLLADAQVQVYLEYVDAVGLGWDVRTETDLVLPAYGQGLTLTHASAATDA